MAKSSMKIVLVDPLGDILFAGDSLIGPVNDDDAPEASTTTTTTVSGIYPRRRIGVETEQDVDENAEAEPDAPSKGLYLPTSTAKRTRAA